MSHEVYYHFPQADGQARRAGARGGKPRRATAASVSTTSPLR
jgi:hypothetical protein